MYKKGKALDSVYDPHKVWENDFGSMMMATPPNINNSTVTNV